MKQIRIDKRIYTKESIEFVRIEKWLLDVGDALACDIYCDIYPKETKKLFLPKENPIDMQIKMRSDETEYLYIRKEDLSVYYHF
ncbi:MAG: hypothetical protein PHU29_06325, partial [Sulfuricurvum sp.]|nr:hypothetical protein [Sulfuricurvum sp.]